MSIAVASSECAPSKPEELTPYNLAVMAQRAIGDQQRQAETQAGLIRQLMIGRHVRRKDDGTIWLVNEVRMSLGWRAVLYGRSRRCRSRNAAIGMLAEVEIVNTPEVQP